MSEDEGLSCLRQARAEYYVVKEWIPIVRLEAFVDAACAMPDEIAERAIDAIAAKVDEDARESFLATVRLFRGNERSNA